MHSLVYGVIVKNGYALSIRRRSGQKGFDLSGIPICEADFCHCRVRASEYIRMSGKILLQSKVSQSHR